MDNIHQEWRLVKKRGIGWVLHLADDLEPLESATTIELNFALVKFKHTVN